MNRRQALQSIGGLAGTAALSRFVSGCDDSNHPVGITNYIYLMLENRTYDHLLGSRKLLEGLGGDGLVASMANKDMNGTSVPVYHAPDPQLCVPDPPHGWDPSHAQWNAGMNDGFLTQYQLDHGMPLTEVMSYLTRDNLPVTYALADQYATCDRWFASVMGPTLPNRAYWHTATSFGLKDNNSVLQKFGSVPVPTIYNRLLDKGVEWTYYSGPLAVVSLLGNAGPFQVDVDGRIKRFSAFADMPDDKNGDFFKDCAAGKLPPVVYIDPFFGSNDDHPPAHPIMGQALIAAIYHALANSPQWRNCMLVITYDEHGGFFDHVSPGQTTDDTLAKFGVDGFQQMGFRVPALCIGPYVKQSYVSSVQYDHTSALKHLQNAFDLETLNPRMNAANDLSDVIDMDRLAKGQWAKPIQIPTIDLSLYQDALNTQACMAGSPFRTLDPISEWANANPGKMLDYRAEGSDSYHQGIIEFLRSVQRS